jgi:drug/metabolite transporter (DMT)-like permease
LLFAAMGVIWGIPYALIKVAVRDFDPGTLVFFRTGVGALLLLPVAAGRGDLRPVLAAWRPLLLYTVAELAVPWVLLSSAETKLPSSLSGLLIAAVPLVGAAIAKLIGGHDPLGGRGIGGLLVGLVGVGVLVGFDVSGSQTSAVLMVAVVVVGYATGPILLARYLRELPALGVVAASLTICAIAYAPWGLTHLPTASTPPHVWVAVAALGAVCTAAAFVLFFDLISIVGPVRATVITYVNPAVAVIIGVAFLGESFGVATTAGFVLILGGSVLAARRRRPEHSPVPVAAVGDGG